MAKNKSVSAIYADELPSKKEKPSISINISEDMLPGIKEMTIDEEKTFTIKGKISSIEKNEWDEGKMRCSMKITSIKEV